MKKWWIGLSRFAIPHWPRLGIVSCMTLMIAGLDVLKPWPMKLIVDNVLAHEPLPDSMAWTAVLPGGSSSLGLLAWLAAGTIFLFLASQSLRVGQQYVQTGVGTRMVFDLGTRLLDHLQRASLSFHGASRAGDLVRRVTNDSTCVRTLFIGVLLPLLTSTVTLIAMFAVMWQLDTELSLVAVLVVPILIILIRRYDRPMVEHAYEHQQLEGEMMALAEQTLTALPVVQSFGREIIEGARFRDLSRRTLGAYVASLMAQMKFRVGVSGATAIGTGAIMVVGGLHVLNGSLTIGALLVFLSYLVSLYQPLETVAYLTTDFSSAAASARRVIEVLELDPGVRDQPDARPLPMRPPGERGRVRFESVSFGFQAEVPVLNEVSLEAHPGQTVALVGPTGAGKSTLVSLIPRLFDPWKGRILFDGLDVRRVQLESLRAEVSFVLQDPFLLPLTIAENIAYGRPGAKASEVRAAAIAANADEFIVRLPEAYDTVIGERGSTLSGGQKQRLAIARAVLKGGAVLILDEPTSALDAETEELLMDALRRLMVGRTTFVIAHRLSTVSRSDLVIVMEKGSIVESGSPKELLSRDGPFRRLRDAQTKDIFIDVPFRERKVTP